jgi:hypothetical protein
LSLEFPSAYHISCWIWVLALKSQAWINLDPELLLLLSSLAGLIKSSLHSSSLAEKLLYPKNHITKLLGVAQETVRQLLVSRSSTTIDHGPGFCCWIPWVWWQPKRKKNKNDLEIEQKLYISLTSLQTSGGFETISCIQFLWFSS